MEIAAYHLIDVESGAFKGVHMTPINEAQSPLCGARPWSWSIFAVIGSVGSTTTNVCATCRAIARMQEA